MLRRTIVCLTLSIAACAQATTPGFLLGMDYSEWGPGLIGPPQIGSSNAFQIYVAKQ